MGRTSSYNGKPSSAQLPELGDDLELPTAAFRKDGGLRKGGPKKLAEKGGGQSAPSPDPIPAAQIPFTGRQSVSTTATGNRGADIYSKDRTFDAQAHDWRQEGRQLVCYTCPENFAHATIIPVGLQLVGSRGNWSFAPEGGVCRAHGKRMAECDSCQKLLAKTT